MKTEATPGNLNYRISQRRRCCVHAYLGGCANTLGCLPIRVGGTEDLVHLLTTLSRTAAEFVKEIKRNHQDPLFIVPSWL